MPTIFVDESGPFKECEGDKYFVIASFTVGEPARTAKRFRVWCHTKLPRKMWSSAEIKFSSNGLTDEQKLKTIKCISELDVRIHYAYFQCKNLPAEYIHKGRILGGRLYTQVLAEVIEQYFPSTDGTLFVICDQRKLNGVSAHEFKQDLEARIIAGNPSGTVPRIDRVDSTGNTNIQIVDWIAGAIAANLNNKRLGKEYMEILRNNIIGEGHELFVKSEYGRK